MKIIVWGLPLHSHTHSYIHHAFARASMAMGYETCWVENSEKSNEIVRHDDIVISCGVADSFLSYKQIAVPALGCHPFAKQGYVQPLHP
jgi:hypothetical protein